MRSALPAALVSLGVLPKARNLVSDFGAPRPAHGADFGLRIDDGVGVSGRAVGTGSHKHQPSNHRLDALPGWPRILSLSERARLIFE